MTETFNKGGEPNKIEGLPVVNISLEELRAETDINRAALEKAQREKSLATDTTDEFKSFKYEAKLTQANEAYRHSVVNLLGNSPSVVTLNNNNKDYKDIFNGYQGDWKTVINDPKAVALVKESTAVEKAVLGAPLHPEGLDIDLTKMENDATKSKALEQADAIIARLEERNKARALQGKEVTVNNFTAEEQAAKKEEWLRKNPQELDIDLSMMELEAGTMPKVPTAPVNVDSNLDALEADDRMAKMAKAPVSVAASAPTLERVIPLENKAEERKELAKIFEKNVEAAPQKKMENISKVLEQKRNESKANLENMGANWLSKSMEAFKKIDPKYKLALGVTLAGASVASGGLTAVVGAGVMKGMSAFSYGTAIYDKMLKAKMDRGLEVNKAAIATNAALLGIGAALATSWIVSEVFSHVNVGDTLDAMKEKASSVKEGIKNWWSGLGATPVPVDFSAVPVNGLDLPVDITSAPVNGLDLPPEPVVGGPESIMILPEYTVAPGDNLTKIIREQVLSTIPGVENLTEFQKNNMIENYLKEAAKYKDLQFFDSVNQFSNPNLIQPGAKLNVTSMRQAMVSFNFPGLGGETLLEHAKALTGSGTSAVGLGSSVVSGAPGGIAEPYLTASSAAPLSVETEPYLTAASSAPFSNVEPYATATSSAPFSEVEPYATATSQAPFSDNEPYLTADSQVPNATPTVPDGVVLDGSGNPVRTGSGGTLQSGGVSDNRR